MFWVRLVYFNVRNILPKFGTFPPDTIYIYIYTQTHTHTHIYTHSRFDQRQFVVPIIMFQLPAACRSNSYSRPSCFLVFQSPVWTAVISPRRLPTSHVHPQTRRTKSDSLTVSHHNFQVFSVQHSIDCELLFPSVRQTLTGLPSKCLCVFETKLKD